MGYFLALLLVFLLPEGMAIAQNFYPIVEPIWDSNIGIPATGRPNPYALEPHDYQDSILRGKKLALEYPVTVTGVLIPGKTALRFLDAGPGDPLFKLFSPILKLKSDFKNFQGFWNWLGLHEPKIQDQDASLGIESPFYFPERSPLSKNYPYGVSFIERHQALGVTISCAGCHVGQFLGRNILGMTNRFPRSNSFFVHGKSALTKVPTGVFQMTSLASKGEAAIYRESRKNIFAVGVKEPLALGLDTSLSQVALSMARRSPNGDKNKSFEKNPRPNLLDHQPADSKPAVWWSLKYKNRWLSDGSILSGNPILTNFLWNEIGRGVELDALSQWIDQNKNSIRDLTTAVFSTQAPKWSDFFPVASIRLEKAKRGEILFQNHCAKCHGEYEKAWHHPESWAQNGGRYTLIDTIQVRYFEKTPIKNVGTSPLRREGMTALRDALNPLSFSIQNQIVIEKSDGYVPPVLEGLFVRFPYLHNNSIPSLCALMTPPENRPESYFMHEIRSASDFDSDCVGYATKKSGKNQYFSKTLGLSNEGHYEKIFRTNGVEKFTGEQKSELIEFLKTL